MMTKAISDKTGKPFAKPARLLGTFSMASLLLCVSLTAAEDAPAGPPEQDRAAILAMVGEFEVSFQFEEVLSLQPDYQLKDAYNEDATEMVVVVSDTGDEIVLQHILEVGSRVVKHWKQVWTWQDTRMFEFQGRDQWAIRDMEASEVEGTWTQLVTQVDDSPRYESYGEWKHDGGYSRWESEPTPRPLPRREHTKRDDYQILLAVNRHALTPTGWVHEQDNLKMVIDDEGEPVKFLAREVGQNFYDYTDEYTFKGAKEYWSETKEFWALVSAFWEEQESQGKSYAVTAKSEDETMMRELFSWARKVQEGEDLPSSEEVSAAIGEFVSLQ